MILFCWMGFTAWNLSIEFYSVATEEMITYVDNNEILNLVGTRQKHLSIIIPTITIQGNE